MARVNILSNFCDFKQKEADAVVCDEERISFHQLDLISNKIANFLNELNIGKGDRVALLVKKNWQQIATILACFKANSAYIPISLGLPPSRINYIINKCQPSAIVVFDSLLDSVLNKLNCIDFSEDKIIILGDHFGSAKKFHYWKEIEECSDKYDFNLPADDDLAYIIFTSGSTGDPKGVPITHKNLSYFNGWVVSLLKGKEDLSALNIAQLYFDQSVMDLCFLFGCGISLHIFNNLLHPLLIAEYIKKHQINILSTVPTIFNLFYDERQKIGDEYFNSLLYCFSGGSALMPALVNRFREKFKRAVLYNLYGPTEATVYATYYIFSEEELNGGIKEVPLGIPLPDHKVYLDYFADDNSRGEIIIEGPQVMSGYWGDKDLTKKVIIDKGKEYLAYKTGDIGRIDAFGNLYFVGRMDETLKRSGVRIDLCDIENNVLKSGLVRECAVVAKPDKDRENIIVLFVVLGEGVELNVLNKWIEANIPKDMLPDKTIVKNALPKNQSDKIDKKKLKAEI